MIPRKNNPPLPGLPRADIHVKICGLTQPDNARDCARAGAHIIGLVFHPPSPRHVETDQARAIVRALPESTLSYGVFVDREFDFIMETADTCGLSGVQLHGNEAPELVNRLRGEGLGVIKALFASRPPEFHQAGAYENAHGLLVECGRGKLPGGNARAWDYQLPPKTIDRSRLILAGGLTPDTVARALAQARPAAVDLSSGVESAHGIKDMSKVKALMAALAIQKP
ncbi:MAG: phosphoribosylanthranilate isomerase [Desulfobacterales bacterium]|nr:phosphoribosylanthranilate isomerase [Desulfobacterales bacterium]